MQAFSEELDQHGFTILMASHGFDLDREYAVLRKLLEHRVDGIALIGLDHTENAFQLLEEQAIPTISMWNHEPDSRLSCVGADNFEAGRLAAEQLLTSGHSKIATVFPDADQNDRARSRWQGAASALSAAGVMIPKNWQFRSLYSIHQSKQVCIQILSQPDRPTALLCGNDVIAHGAMFAAQELRIDLPEGLSIIGVGDFKGSSELVPALTTVRIPARQIGSLGAQRLVSMVGNSDQEIIRDKCELRLMNRKSVHHLN